MTRLLCLLALTSLLAVPACGTDAAPPGANDLSVSLDVARINDNLAPTRDLADSDLTALDLVAVPPDAAVLAPDLAVADGGVFTVQSGKYALWQDCIPSSRPIPPMAGWS